MKKVIALFKSYYPIESRTPPIVTWRTDRDSSEVNPIYTRFVNRLAELLLPYADVEIEELSGSKYSPSFKLFWTEKGKAVCDMKFYFEIEDPPEVGIRQIYISTFKIHPAYIKRRTQKKSLMPILISNLRNQLRERCDSIPDIHLHASTLDGGKIWGSVAWANVAQFRTREDMFTMMRVHGKFLMNAVRKKNPDLLRDSKWVNTALSLKDNWGTPLDVKQTRLFDTDGNEIKFDVKSDKHVLRVSYGVYFLLHHSWSAKILV